MRSPVRLTAGQDLELGSFGPVTQTDIVRFAGAGGDFNPLHHDPAFAAKAGFDQPIAMGQYTAGLLAAWLTDQCGVEHLRSYGVRFTSPVGICDEITFRGAVDEVSGTHDGFAVARLSLQATCGDRTVVRADASVVVTSP